MGAAGANDRCGGCRCGVAFSWCPMDVPCCCSANNSSNSRVCSRCGHGVGRGKRATRHSSKCDKLDMKNNTVSLHKPSNDEKRDWSTASLKKKKQATAPFNRSVQPSPSTSLTAVSLSLFAFPILTDGHKCQISKLTGFREIDLGIGRSNRVSYMAGACTTDGSIEDRGLMGRVMLKIIWAIIARGPVCCC